MHPIQPSINQQWETQLLDGRSIQGPWPAPSLPVGPSPGAARGESDGVLVGKGVELREAATVFQGWGHKPGVVTVSATGPRQAISPLSDLLPFILCFFVVVFLSSQG